MKDNASLSLTLPSGADFLSGVCVVRPAKVELSITAASQDPGGGGISMATGACTSTSTPTPTHHTTPLLRPRELLIGEEVVAQLSETTRASTNSTINVLYPCVTV